MSEIEVRWMSAPDFAEVADVLGIRTVDVMAVMNDGVALYTPDPDDEDPMIWRAELERVAQILCVRGVPRVMCSTSEFHDRMKELIGEIGKEDE